MQKKLVALILLVLVCSGCTYNTKPKTIDLLKVDSLNVIPSGDLNTNDYAQIRMRITNTGHSPANLTLEERKIKRYNLWGQTTGEHIFREGNTWFKWDYKKGERQILSYAEYVMEDAGDVVTIIKSDRTEEKYELKDEFITLIGNKYKKGDELSKKTKIELAKESHLPEKITDKEFKADSVFTRHCGNLYDIKEFSMYPPTYDIELGKSEEIIDIIGEDKNEYSRSVIVKRYITLNPKDSVELVWAIQAPSNKETMGLMQPCKFGFNVKYNAFAKSEANIYFVNPIEIIQGSIADEEIKIEGTTVRTYGPLEIKIDTTAQQPIKSSIDDKSNRFTLKLIILNKGAGIGHIKSLKLKLNKDYNYVFQNIGDDEFHCDFGETEKTSELSINKNNPVVLNKLKIYRGKTSQISCTLTAPKVNLVEPYRFIAEADYDYIIEGQLNIKTKPDEEI